MTDLIPTVNNTLKTNVVKNAAASLLEKIIGIFEGDPIAALTIIQECRALPSALRDEIFFESFEAFLLKLNDYDFAKQQFDANNLRKLAQRLAETSPNEESGYEGNPEDLNAYTKRIVKLIDDCGTKQKAIYLANLTRAYANGMLDNRSYFKLGQCIRMLTEEDLLLLKRTITEDVIVKDEDYIDDFRSVGLIKEVEGGFAFQRRAFELLKYAVDYEGNIKIPEKYPERYKGLIAVPLDENQITDAIKKSDLVDEIAEKARPQWEVVDETLIT